MSYNGASSITLIDGTVISDPANTQATSAQCLPFMCGADPNNSDARYWCAFWGQYGALVGCVDSRCAAFKSQIPGCDIVAPTIEIPNPPQVALVPANLTTANIVQPLPSITQANHPVTLPSQDDSCFCQLNQMINDNPVVSLLVLAGVATFILRGR